MPVSCAVVGCTLRCCARTRLLGINFYSIPSENIHKRRQWLTAINRKNWKPTKWQKVCGRHFVCGKPSNDPDDVDYRPTKYLKGGDFAVIPATHKQRQFEQTSQTSGRRKRALRRQERECLVEIAEVKN